MREDTVTTMKRVLPALLAVLLLVAPIVAADDATPAWAALAKGGHVALIRHGNAPPGYGGDPPGMRLDDCTTQRNLDDVGRAQAKALGEEFRKHGVRVDKVMASPFCRTIETAELMAVGSVEKSTALLPDTGVSQPRFQALKELIANWRGPGTLVLVTHGLSIRPVAGYLPEQAVTVVVQPVPDNARGGNIVGSIAAALSGVEEQQ
jgi:broad specificity phosphatase PhoE